MEFIVGENAFILLRINPVPEFKDGKPTGNTTGYAYECVEVIDFNRITVKVEGQKKPLMADEALQERRESGEKIFVEFVNGTVMAYVSQKDSIEDSFKADGVKLVETEL